MDKISPSTIIADYIHRDKDIQYEIRNDKLTRAEGINKIMDNLNTTIQRLVKTGMDSRDALNIINGANYALGEEYL